MISIRAKKLINPLMQHAAGDPGPHIPWALGGQLESWSPNLDHKNCRPRKEVLWVHGGNMDSGDVTGRSGTNSHTHVQSMGLGRESCRLALKALYVVGAYRIRHTGVNFSAGQDDHKL